MFRSIQRFALVKSFSQQHAIKRISIVRPSCLTMRHTTFPFQYRPQGVLFHTKTALFEQQQKEEEEVIDPQHKMLIGFTCKVCQDRSHHVMSKHSYTKGVVLIQCPGCKNRHLIADNLGWFRDSKTTVEDLVKEKGEAIRRVVVGQDGVEKLGDLMEWLPEIAEEEKAKKAEAKLKAEELKETQQQE